MHSDNDKKGGLVEYTKPAVVDYGTVEELTAAQGPNGSEDPNGSKAFHGTAPQG